MQLQKISEAKQLDTRHPNGYRTGAERFASRYATAPGNQIVPQYIQPESDTLPTLQGTRVLLRQLTRSDLRALLRIFGDPAVARHMGIPRLREADAAERLLREIAAGLKQKTLFQWGLADAASNALLGTCSLSGMNWPHQRAEIGFALRASHWGAGLMSEALPLLISHAFSALSLHRLEADVDPRNARSLRLLEKLGFRREGFLPQRHLVGGERQDSVLLGLLASEWPPMPNDRSSEGGDRSAWRSE